MLKINIIIQKSLFCKDLSIKNEKKILNLLKILKIGHIFDIQYNIEYQKEEFLNKDFLFNGINNFAKILRKFSPLIKSILFIKKKLGQKK